MPFASIASCAKMLGQYDFRWAKPACFHFSSSKNLCAVLWWPHALSAWL
jgi:hypothetical protein